MQIRPGMVAFFLSKPLLLFAEISLLMHLQFLELPLIWSFSHMTAVHLVFFAIFCNGKGYCLLPLAGKVASCLIFILKTEPQWADPWPP